MADQTPSKAIRMFILVALVLALITPGVAAAYVSPMGNNIRMMLEIGGITDDCSLIYGYQDCSELSVFTLAVASDKNKPETYLDITRSIDRASPKFLDASVRQREIPNATLWFISKSDPNTLFYSVELKNVKFVQVGQTFDQDLAGSYPAETVRLGFESATWKWHWIGV
jgi:type VI protein secretion system component Hcp